MSENRLTLRPGWRRLGEPQMVNNPTGEKMKGNWNQFKGRVREKWGELTDDELDRVQGRREQLVGRIQERSGEARQDIEREIERYSTETGYRF